MDGDICCYSAGMNPIYIVIIVGVVVLLLAGVAMVCGKRHIAANASSSSVEENKSSITHAEKSGTSSSVACDLKQLAELHERGMLSKQEFVQAKQRVISDAPPAV